MGTKKWGGFLAGFKGFQGSGNKNHGFSLKQMNSKIIQELRLFFSQRSIEFVGCQGWLSVS